MRHQPGLEGAVRLHVPETIASQAKQHTVHEDPTLGRAGDGVTASSLVESGDPSRQHLLEEGHRVRTGYLHRLLGDIVNEGLATQCPVLLNRILTVVDGEETAGVDAAHHVRTVVSLEKGRYLEAPGADPHGVVDVQIFLDVHG